MFLLDPRLPREGPEPSLSKEKGTPHRTDLLRVIKMQERHELFSQAPLPEYLQRGKHSRNDVPSVRKDLHGSQGDLDGPRKTQDHVFYNGTIVVCLQNKTDKQDGSSYVPRTADRPLQAFRELQHLLLNH